MKHIVLALGLAVVGTTATADLLTRYEAAETAILKRHGELNGYPATGWTPQDRTGKACLLEELLATAGAQTAEGYVSYLEDVATRSTSYRSSDELTDDWMRATSENRIWFEDMTPITQKCGGGF